MPTKKITPKRSARKPLDEFAEIKALVRREIKRIERKLDIVDDRCEEIAGYEVMRRKAQELGSKKEEQGRWVPKVGEWAYILDTVPGYQMPVGTCFEIARVDDMGDVWSGPTKRWPGGCCFRTDETQGHCLVRKALPHEIESSAYGEIELQEGDACAASEATKAFLLEHTDLIPEKCQHYCVETYGWLLWSDNRLWAAGDQYAPIMRGSKAIPEPVFLRRAKITAEKLRAAREEEEAKKPLEFGQRVKVKDHEEAIFWYAQGDKYKLVFPGGDFLTVPRREITVLNPT